MARRTVSKKDASAWWQASDHDAYKLATQWVLQSRTALKPWYDSCIYNLELYSGTSDITGCGVSYGSTARDKLKLNVSSMVVDTALSIVGSARTLPYYLPKGGDWSTQRKAKRCTNTLQSQFQNLGIFNYGVQVIADGMITGLGALHFFVDSDTGQPGLERILPLELSFDPIEAMNGEPRTIARSKPVNRDVAKALFPKHKDALDTSKGPSFENRRDFAFQRDSQADQIVLHEIWRLPSKKDGSDGKHLIFADNVTLLSEPWKRKRFPIAFYRWTPRQLGFLGKSLVEEAEPTQRRVEQNLRFVETCQDLGSKPQVWLEKGAEVEPQQIDNLPMSVNRFAGTPPSFFTFDATPHDVEASIDKLIARLMDQLGLSQSQITGEKPAGVTSAVGLKTVEEVSSRRHTLNIRQVEKLYLESSNCLSDVNDELTLSNPGYAIDRSVRGKWLEATRWKEVAPMEDDMQMSVYPTSSLPPSPAGQLDMVTDWINTQVIPPDAGMMLLGLPDTQAFSDVETADRTFIEHQCEKMLEGKRVIPNQYTNLTLGMDLVRRHMLNAEADGAPEPVLNQFRYWLSVAKNITQKATTAQNPVAPGIPPPADPAMAPQAAAALPPGAGPAPMG